MHVIVGYLRYSGPHNVRIIQETLKNSQSNYSRLVCGMAIPLGKGIVILRNRRWRNGMTIPNL